MGLGRGRLQMLGGGGSGGVDPATATVIQALSPTGYWKLDEASGNFAATVGAVTGTAVTTTERPGPGPHAGQRGAFLASEANALATFGDNFRFNGTGSFTVLLWHAPRVIGTNHRRVVTKEAAADGWMLRLNTTGVPCFDRKTSSTDVSANGPSAMTVGQYGLIAAVYDGTADTLTAYLNGVAGTPASDARSIGGTATLVRLNGEPGSGAAFAPGGAFAHFAVWDGTALSAEQIQSVHAAR